MINNIDIIYNAFYPDLYYSTIYVLKIKSNIFTPHLHTVKIDIRDVSPYHAEFLKWNNPPSIFDTLHYYFMGYQDENLNYVIQQYIIWSDWHGSAGWPGSIYWCQRLTTFGVGRIRVKISLEHQGYTLNAM